jgi:hypothetical protein
MLYTVVFANKTLWLHKIRNREAGYEICPPRDIRSTVAIDISQYGLLFGFSLLYTDRVPFELLDSAAIL